MTITNLGDYTAIGTTPSFKADTSGVLSQNIAVYGSFAGQSALSNVIVNVEGTVDSASAWATIGTHTLTAAELSTGVFAFNLLNAAMPLVRLNITALAGTTVGTLTLKTIH